MSIEFSRLHVRTSTLNDDIGFEPYTSVSLRIGADVYDWTKLEFQKTVADGTETKATKKCGQGAVNAPILKASSISAGIGRVTGWRRGGKGNLARSNCYPTAMAKLTAPE
jgi:hypothetical protein